MKTVLKVRLTAPPDGGKVWRYQVEVFSGGLRSVYRAQGNSAAEARSQAKAKRERALNEQTTFVAD